MGSEYYDYSHFIEKKNKAMGQMLIEGYIAKNKQSHAFLKSINIVMLIYKHKMI